MNHATPVLAASKEQLETPGRAEAEPEYLQLMKSYEKYTPTSLQDKSREAEMKQIENKLGMLISKYGFPEITPHVYDKPSLQNRVNMQEKIITRVTVTEREITRNMGALDKTRNSATQELQRITKQYQEK